MSRSIAGLLVFSCVVTCTAVSTAAPEDKGPYSWTRYSESIPARDNGTITALVYTTGAQGKRPLVIFRHGFLRSAGSLAACGEHWASRGFNVILNDARTRWPDCEVSDPADMIDCAGWAIQKSTQSGHYLQAAVDSDAVIIGGFSAGGYTALIAAHRACALGDGGFTCAALVLFDPYPADAGRAAELARAITTPAIMLHADDAACNGRGKGKIIFKNTAGPTYAVHIRGASHCDFEPRASTGCNLLCAGAWNHERNTAVMRYATAMIEACALGTADAYPYLNGPAAQADTRITVYPQTRGLELLQKAGGRMPRP